MLQSINPYNSEVVFTHKKHNSEEIKNLIVKTSEAHKSWKNTTLEERKRLIYALSEVLLKHKEEYAKIMCLEVGKPISQAVAEVEKCAWVCRYYADNVEKQLKPKLIETDATKSYVRYDALGVILGVMPWNYPFWQVYRFAVPTIIAGNTVLLKHASNVMQSASLIQQSFKEAGFEEHIFTNLVISSDAVESIIRNPLIKGVSLTGSKPAGSAVAKVAGEEIKPSLLELGGNNALIVFDDCNIEQTLDTVIQARFQNTGQSCIAGKRLLIHESISDLFLEKLINKVNNLKSGNPLNKDTFIGTLINEKASEELNRQLQKSVEKGAKILIGGHYNKAYFEPTLVSNVTDEMPIYTEETFGPLLACITFKTEQEALEIVNSSQFGLGISIFTKDTDRIERLIPQFEDGAVFVNDLVKSHPHLPFGGTKISGYGRELSEEGIYAFVNKKTVYIK